MAWGEFTNVEGAGWHLLPYELVDAAVPAMEAEWERARRDAAAARSEFAGVRLRVPPDEGRGVIDLIRPTAHLWVMIFDAEYTKDREIQVPGDRMIKVRILLSGRLETPRGVLRIDGAGAYLEAFPGEVASSYVLRAGVPIRFLVLCCDPEFFTEDIGLPADRLPYPLSHIFTAESGASRLSPTALGPELLRAANDMMHASTAYPQDLIGAYLGAKGREIACSVVRELRLASEAESRLTRYSVRDVNRVHEARDILIRSYQRAPTIARLARQIGLNQTKLKAAFKAVFGSTINDFTRRRRMERATELLMGTGLTISQVAQAVGYAHPANFTQAFKSVYGHSPRQLRRATLSG